MVTTVEEVRKRKKKREEEEETPEARAERLALEKAALVGRSREQQQAGARGEAAAVAEELVPEAFTQADLDRLRRQGIDVFRGVNIARLSRAEQVTAEEREAAGQAALGGIEAFEAARETAEPTIEPAKLVTTAEKGTKFFRPGERAREEAERTGRTLTRTNEQLDKIDKYASGPARAAWSAIGNLGAVPLVGDIIGGISFNSIIADQEQVITNTREGLQKLSGEVETGLRDPEDAILRIATLEANVNQAYKLAHRAGKFSTKAWLEGLDTMEVRLLRAQDDVLAARAKIIREIARRETQPQRIEGAQGVAGTLT